VNVPLAVLKELHEKINASCINLQKVKEKTGISSTLSSHSVSCCLVIKLNHKSSLASKISTPLADICLIYTYHLVINWEQMRLQMKAWQAKKKSKGM
jgi:hypothetical protein